MSCCNRTPYKHPSSKQLLHIIHTMRDSKRFGLRPELNVLGLFFSCPMKVGTRILIVEYKKKDSTNVVRILIFVRQAWLEVVLPSVRKDLPTVRVVFVSSFFFFLQTEPTNPPNPNPNLDPNPHG